MKPQHNRTPSHFFIYFDFKTQPGKTEKFAATAWDQTIRPRVLYQLMNFCEWQGFRFTVYWFECTRLRSNRLTIDELTIKTIALFDYVQNAAYCISAAGCYFS